MPLFLTGCFPVDFQEVKRPLRAKLGNTPLRVENGPLSRGNGPLKAMVLVGISVGCLMGCFPAPPLWRKTAPLKRPIKRSMIWGQREVSDWSRVVYGLFFFFSRICATHCRARPPKPTLEALESGLGPVGAHSRVWTQGGGRIIGRLSLRRVFHPLCCCSLSQYLFICMMLMRYSRNPWFLHA